MCEQCDDRTIEKIAKLLALSEDVSYDVQISPLPRDGEERQPVDLWTPEGMPVWIGQMTCHVRDLLRRFREMKAERDEAVSIGEELTAIVGSFLAIE